MSAKEYITEPKKVVELSYRTGLPLLVCREALARAGGEVEVAMGFLRWENHHAELVDDICF